MTTDAQDDLARATARVAGLDLETKVALLTGASAFSLRPEPAIGLRELRTSDGPTGVRGLKFHGGAVVALLPNATLLASAWNEDAAYEVGQLLADEAMAQQIHVVLGPTINLHRTLLGGRLFEQYSEDPLLTGKLAAAYVRGLQSQRVAACLKHLIANESETERNTVNSVVDEATLHELYLLPFEIAVAESDPWSIMAAYNDVNGVPATEQHEVMTGIVRDEWGYTGLILSDWFATKSAAAAANAGLDLVMPGPRGPWGASLVAAVRAGEIAEAVVDEHLHRLLLLADRTGALGAGRDYPATLPAPDSPGRRAALTRLAASGMTVLTNRDEVLPLARGQRIALIGRHALETIDMGGGSAQVNPPYQVSIAEGLLALVGEGSTVTDGVPVRNRPVVAKPGFVTDPQSGAAGVRLNLRGASGAVLSDGPSSSAAAVVGFDDDFAEPVALVTFRGRIETVGPVEIGVMGVGDWELRVGDRTERISLRASGTGMGEEILAPPVRLLRFELASPTEVIATTATQLVDGALPGPAMYGLLARAVERPDDEVIADAVRAAEAADVAVVVVGLTEEQETEAVDKSTLRLPGQQDELVRRVAAVARRTVVVVNAATPVVLPWLDDVDAVLWIGLPGQEGGHAVAAALLGEVEPAGRLVTTFPVADGATPAWSVTPVDGDLDYSEGTFIGYRGHYADRAPAPAFWFGHGLGYGIWSYSAAQVVAGSPPGVRVVVTNTGSRASREVVQVYLRPVEADQPVRLVGWSSVTVDPGETATVDVATEARMWRRWDPVEKRWASLAAGGELLVARGLGDVRHVLPL